MTPDQKRPSGVNNSSGQINPDDQCEQQPDDSPWDIDLNPDLEESEGVDSAATPQRMNPGYPHPDDPQAAEVGDYPGHSGSALYGRVSPPAGEQLENRDEIMEDGAGDAITGEDDDLEVIATTGGARSVEDSAADQVNARGGNGATGSNGANGASEVNEVNHSSKPNDSAESAAVPAVTMPFDSVYAYLRAQILPTSEVISPAQQSKFINYLDEELLKIQRKFIKEQADATETYSLSQLQSDVQALTKLIWISITKRNKLFGQGDYLIKILGDLEDYLFHYTEVFRLESTVPVITGAERSKLIQFFAFFQDLDTKLSILMDGYEVGASTERLSATQIVRLVPIASRLRIQIVSSLDTSRLALQRNIQTSTAAVESRQILDILDVEIGRLFEGILDRSEH